MMQLEFNPETTADAAWLPLINTPSHPEYGAGHPSLNGAAAAVLAANFDDAQTFTLFASGLPNRTYTSISAAESDGNNARQRRAFGGGELAVAYEIADSFTFPVKTWAESPYTTVTEARSVNCHRQLSAPPTRTTSNTDQPVTGSTHFQCGEVTAATSGNCSRRVVRGQVPENKQQQAHNKDKL